MAPLDKRGAIFGFRSLIFDFFFARLIYSGYRAYRFNWFIHVMRERGTPQEPNK